MLSGHDHSTVSTAVGQDAPARADCARGRRAAVTGCPIGHSLSPVLHRAAYAALGLTGWTYEAVEVPTGELRSWVSTLGPEWAGLSVTMPGKEEAFALSDQASESARLTGAANTLVRAGGGWTAHNTDVEGLASALRTYGLLAPARATVIGGGATARSALVALRGLGVQEATIVVRDGLRPQTRALAERLDLLFTVQRLGDRPVTIGREVSDVVISTLPVTARAPAMMLVGGGPPIVMDVAYAPWPSPLALAVQELGPSAPLVMKGTEMLLRQAAGQVRLMTGHDGPVEAMRAALTAQEQTR